MSNPLFQEKMEGCRLPAWEYIPDLGLYMDQVLTYVERTLPALDPLTASMINNYVKAGLIEKPTGKKYSRTAMAQLLIICVLKQTIAQDAIRRLLYPADGSEMETVYAAFRETQATAMDRLAEKGAPSPLSCALESACLATAFRLLMTEEE